MPRLSQTLDADVIVRSDCSVAGRVSDVYFDEKCRNVAYFVVDDGERVRLLPVDEVLSLKDALVVADPFPFLSAGDADLTPLKGGLLSKKVYTAGGKFRGSVTDIEFTAKGRVRSVTVGEETFSPASFGAVGDVMLLKDGSDARKKRKKTPFPKAGTDYPVAALSPSPATPPTAEVRPAEEDPAPSVPLPDAASGVTAAADENFTPYRVIADYNFLLGRTLTDDLLSYSGKRLATRGERVTAELVETARRQGKLMDLTLSSR